MHKVNGHEHFDTYALDDSRVGGGSMGNMGNKGDIERSCEAFFEKRKMRSGGSMRELMAAEIRRRKGQG